MQYTVWLLKSMVKQNEPLKEHRSQRRHSTEGPSPMGPFNMVGIADSLRNYTEDLQDWLVKKLSPLPREGSFSLMSHFLMFKLLSFLNV